MVTRLTNADPIADRWSVSRHAVLLLAFAATMTHCSQAQNIEGQPIAAQYGEFEVQNEGNGFAFDPANCNVTGGGENFFAFTTGTPVKVVDAVPAQTEVSNIVTAYISGSNCAVSLGGLAYQHTSFYLTSGTGGLQEALNNEKIRAGGNNTIILNSRWYELIAPRPASTVISTVSGSSSFGLVDITTNPYTSYNWNGSQYVQAAPPAGSPSGAAGGALSGNYPNPGLSSNPIALPAGSTATTCTPGENDNNVATNACVAASASSGGAPSGTAGGSLSGTYPNPTIVGTTINPKVINGVSYSVNYPQATVAQRINAACADALNRANANTSGKCSSEGEAITQTDTSGTTITIGNSSGTEVTWIHPPICEWTFSGYSGGTADIIDLYGGSSIEGETPVNNPCMIKYGGGTYSAYAVFQALVGTSGNTYFKVKGMGFYDSTASLQSGATMVVNSTSDGSLFEDLLLTNYEPGQSSLLLNDAISYGQCCATTFNRIVANGNYNSGPIVKIIATGTNNQSSVEFTNSSFTHPAPGYPVISCSSTNTNGESLYFDDVYEEANHTDNTTALNQSNGCLAIKVNGMTVSDPGATSPYNGAPIWQLNGTLQTSFDLSGLTAVHGFAQPVVAVQNNISGFNCASTPCNVLTDANGNLAHYTNGTFRGDVISASVALKAPSLGTILQADGFPVAGGTYAGIYGAGTTYTQFQTVTYSGADWICLGTCTGVAPAAAAAGGTQYWAQFDSTGAGLAATQADTAFFSAWGQVQAGATSFTAYSGVSLVFGNRAGGYNKNGDWVMPTNTFGYTISLFGQGRGGTWIHQTASTLNYMVSSPNVSSSTGQTISGITLDANLLAGGCLSHHLRRSLVSDVACWNPQQQAGGTIGAPMWLGQGADSYETLYQHLLVRGPTYSGLVAAYGTATVTSGAITGITWAGTGTNLNLPVTAGPGLVAYFLGKGVTSSSYQPCGTMPVVSAIALTGGSINTSSGVGGITFTSPGATCGGTIYVRVQQAGTMSEGYYLGGSDTTMDDIVTSGDFKVACEYVNGPFSLKHEHPYCAAPYQIEAAGSGVANFTAPEMDSPIEYGMYIVGSGATVVGGFTEFNAGNEYGAGDYLIDAGATNFSVASSGCYSGSPQSFGGYSKYTGTTAGPLTSTSGAWPASASLSGVQENCDGTASLWGTYPAGGGGANFPASPGVVYNTTTSAARNATPSDFLSLVGYYTGTYSSGTTYKFDDIAADGSGNNYVSLSAGNVGNALTNTTYWHFLGGLSSTIAGGNCVTSGQYLMGISTTGVPNCAQVQFSNLGGSATLAQLPAMANNSLLGNTSGTSAVPSAVSSLPAAVMPALTGDCTTTAGAVATTCTKTNGTALGTAATQNTGTSGATIPLLNGANTHSGAATFSAAGAASTPGLTVTGAPYTGGTATTSFPQFYLNQGAGVTSFSTAGEEFGINAPSGYIGNLINAFINGSSTKFRVDYAGDVFNAGYHTTAANGTASQAAFTLTGAPYTAGTGTTDYPLFYLNNGTAPTTWSTSGTMFGVNGPSGFAGNFLDAHLNGGSSLFSVGSTGAVDLQGSYLSYGGSAGSFYMGSSAGSGGGTLSIGTVNASSAINGPSSLTYLGSGLLAGNATRIGFSNATAASGGTVDSIFCRAGTAGTVSLESAANCTNTVAGGNGTLALAAIIPGVLYSAAGTALPTCASGIKGQLAVVSDATSPTFMGAYTSGGGITAAVICSYNGSAYSWLTH